ncbi:MAG: glutamate--tRNA ligase [Lautropia sp.]|nr:glutamate--tRNA ligase [Lautropia sp.]
MSNVRPPVVRTRFAPSPTGFLHIGGVRTALYAWAYARHFDGVFILRIEDTDIGRSTPEAVAAIIDGMSWLGLTPDEGPYFQMQRMDRYQEVLSLMLADGRAYHCYSTPAELDEMREAQRARGEKPRYDGRWRPENVKGRAAPADVKPVVRFRNPDHGIVQWNDLVKGPIAIANAELDDLIIARSDGTPTYNFCVVVDDWEMAITHVVRGDDHVNNTPRQINILQALGAELPIYGHLPMIHGPDGQKLSKRHGAVSVLQYEELGYLPDAVINYLARLGWSHGDDEIFSRDQLVAWFDGQHLSHSPSQLDFDKFRWVNHQYLKATDDQALSEAIRPRLQKRLAVAAADAGFSPAPACGDRLAAICGLWKDRAATLEELSDLAAIFFLPPSHAPDALARHLTEPARAGVTLLADRLAGCEWSREAIAGCIKGVLAETKLKMPHLAVPVRLLVFGLEQTPSLDAMLCQMPRETVLTRLAQNRLAQNR